MKITVIGTGYVGLVSGVCFSEFGFDVTCVDNNLQKIEQLNQGHVPIYEPGLNKMMIKNVQAKRLRFTSNTAEAVKHADIVFIAVGTPSKEDGNADLSYVFSAADELAPHINRNAVLVIKSTVPVGTTRKIKNKLKEQGLEIEIAFNPEFLKEGAAVNDFMHPDRIILGIESQRAQDILSALYRPLYVFNIPIIFTGLETAELSKYASNAFLAMKVAFINEIADLCEMCNADVNQIAIAMGLDERIGSKFLQAGPGYGGSCFPKDTKAIDSFAKDFGSPVSLIHQTIVSNIARRGKMVQKILNACNGNVQGKNLAILGVTFKANTDDMRDSPSIEIIKSLQQMGANIRIYDPSQSKQAQNIFSDVKFFEDPYQNCSDVDAIIIITDWAEFRALNLLKLREKVKHPLLIDLRNIYTVSEVVASGFEYHSVGRCIA